MLAKIVRIYTSLLKQVMLAGMANNGKIFPFPHLKSDLGQKILGYASTVIEHFVIKTAAKGCLLYLLGANKTSNTLLHCKYGFKKLLEPLPMAKCPKCNQEIAKPDKSLKNHSFQIESYTCLKCKHQFKVTN